MSEPVSISTGIASRYAGAVFDLSREGGALASLEADVAALDTAMQVSADLRDLISSPIYSRDEQAGSIAAIAAKMGLSATVANLLGLMAAKRRLFVLPQLVVVLRAMIAAQKGEVTADVTSAVALSAEQSARLAQTLSAQAGKSVQINAAVDPSLIGGLVVKIGSKMIDTSIRAKLMALQNMMKEVG